MMKRGYAIMLTVMAVALLGGCAGNRKIQAETPAASRAETQAEPRTGIQAEPQHRNESEAAAVKSGNETDISRSEQAPRVLIAYFTWADNTVVENEEEAVQRALAHYESIGDSGRYADVDAVSTASVVPPGNVAQMAAWIQQEIGGDLFSIQVEEPYSSDYDECMERASEERAESARPKLRARVEDMDSYDVVAIGYPNWWYGSPMPVLSFIDENDLSGKKIILFCSHGTGGLAGSVKEITEELPKDCEVEENVIGIYRADIPHGQPAVQEWLKEIGY